VSQVRVPVLPYHLWGKRFRPLQGQGLPGGGGPAPVAGFTWHDGAYATRPAAGGANSDAFSANNDYVFERDDGASAWVPWGPQFPMAESPAAGWSWVNQGGAAIDETTGAPILIAPIVGGFSLRCRVRSMPSAPYTLTACIAFHYLWTSAGNGAGLLLRDSATGRIVTWGYYNGSGQFFRCMHCTDATTYSSAPYGSNGMLWRRMWLQIYDDSVDNYFRVSYDGEHWLTLHSQGRTTWLANPDQIGFFLHAGGGTSDELGVSILSWETS